MGFSAFLATSSRSAGVPDIAFSDVVSASSAALLLAAWTGNPPEQWRRRRPKSRSRAQIMSSIASTSWPPILGERPSPRPLSGPTSPAHSLSRGRRGAATAAVIFAAASDACGRCQLRRSATTL
eukprot:scaffold2072_cov126-Isochrysis_galbana.AAC.3